MQDHPEAAASLSGWLGVARKAGWRSFLDLRPSIPNADMLRVSSGNSVVVFNIARNRCRLITAIHFNCGLIHTMRLLTHREYDRGQWKHDL